MTDVGDSGVTILPLHLQEGRLWTGLPYAGEATRGTGQVVGHQKGVFVPVFRG